jgi:hypothetical protein
MHSEKKLFTPEHPALRLRLAWAYKL